eukprot:jgi/Mesvir1/23272/Mv20978-RA.1
MVFLSTARPASTEASRAQGTAISDVFPLTPGSQKSPLKKGTRLVVSSLQETGIPGAYSGGKDGAHPMHRDPNMNGLPGSVSPRRAARASVDAPSVTLSSPGSISPRGEVSPHAISPPAGMTNGSVRRPSLLRPFFNGPREDSTVSAWSRMVSGSAPDGQDARHSSLPGLLPTDTGGNLGGDVGGNKRKDAAAAAKRTAIIQEWLDSQNESEFIPPDDPNDGDGLGGVNGSGNLSLIMADGSVRGVAKLDGLADLAADLESADDDADGGEGEDGYITGPAGHTPRKLSGSQLRKSSLGPGGKPNGPSRRGSYQGHRGSVDSTSSAFLDAMKGIARAHLDWVPEEDDVAPRRPGTGAPRVGTRRRGSGDDGGDESVEAKAPAKFVRKQSTKKKGGVRWGDETTHYLPDDDDLARKAAGGGVPGKGGLKGKKRGRRGSPPVERGWRSVFGLLSSPSRLLPGSLRRGDWQGDRQAHTGAALSDTASPSSATAPLRGILHRKSRVLAESDLEAAAGGGEFVIADSAAEAAAAAAANGGHPEDSSHSRDDSGGDGGEKHLLSAVTKHLPWGHQPTVRFEDEIETRLERLMNWLPLLDPRARFFHGWLYLTMLCFVYEMWMLPFRFAVGYIPYIPFDISVDSVLFLDVFFALLTAIPLSDVDEKDLNGVVSLLGGALGLGGGHKKKNKHGGRGGGGNRKGGKGENREDDSSPERWPKGTKARVGGRSVSDNPDSMYAADSGFCTNHVVIARHYARPGMKWTKGESCTGRLWADLANYLMYLPLLAGFDSGNGQWAVLVLSLFRMSRVVRLWAFFRLLEIDIHANVRKVALIKFVLVVTGVAHWSGCFYYLLARLRHLSDHTWVMQMVSQGNWAPGLRNMWSRWGLIFFKGMLSMANLGYGGVEHSTLEEMMWAIAVVFIQVVVYAYILGSIFHYLVRKDPSAEAHGKVMASVEAYAESRGLPPELRARMREYFTFQFSKQRDDYGRITQALPLILHMKVASTRFRSVINRAGFLFKRCDQQFLSVLMTKLREVFLMPGEKLFRAHDISSSLCFIVQGKLDIMDDEDTIVGKVVPSDDSHSVVGEVAFFLSMGQPYTVRACHSSDALVLSLSRVDYDELIKSFPEQNVIILKGLLRSYGLDLAGKELVVDKRKKKMSKKGRHTRHFKRLRRAIKSLLSKRHDEDMINIKWACSSTEGGDAAFVAGILQGGFHADNVDYDGRTALHMAAMSGQEDIVRLLLDKGVNVNVKDRWGRTPLGEAVAKNHVVIASMLVAKGAAMALEDPASILCEAACAGDLGLLRSLLDHGVDPNAGDYDRRTAL